MTNSQETESQWLLSGSGLFLALHGWKGQGRIGKCGDCRWGIVDESAAMNGERSRLSFPIHGTVVGPWGPKLFFSAVPDRKRDQFWRLVSLSLQLQERLNTLTLLQPCRSLVEAMQLVGSTLRKLTWLSLSESVIVEFQSRILITFSGSTQ